MKHFKDIPIKKDIFIIASGESRNELTAEDYEKLKEKFFVIGINCVNNIILDARIWSDPYITEYLQDMDKDCLWISRLRAINPHVTKDIAEHIDYWFNDREEKLEREFYTSSGKATSCKWTLYWLLQLLRKHFSDKKVYIIGMDCQDNMSYIYEKGELVHRENSKNNCQDMPDCFKMKKKADPKFFENVFNCSFFSAVHSVEYIDPKGLINA